MIFKLEGVLLFEATDLDDACERLAIFFLEEAGLHKKSETDPVFTTYPFTRMKLEGPDESAGFILTQNTAEP
jgi:hypothetical protein